MKMDKIKAINRARIGTRVLGLGKNYFKLQPDPNYHLQPILPFPLLSYCDFFKSLRPEIRIFNINSSEEIRMPPTYAIQKHESFRVIFEAYLQLRIDPKK